MSRGEWDGDAQRGPGCDDKRGLLVGQIFERSDSRIASNDARGLSQAESPTQVLSPPNPQKSSGCTSHTITLKNKVATKRANLSVLPTRSPRAGGEWQHGWGLFFSPEGCYDFLIFRA